MSDLDDMLSDKGADEKEQTAEEAVEDVKADESQEPAAEAAEGEPEEVESEATDDQPEMVPHQRFHAVNQRNKELEAELEALKKQGQQPKAAPDLSHLFARDENDKLPDPLEDANAYNAAIEQRMQERLYQQGWQASNVSARRHFGADMVDEALASFAEASKENALLQQAARQSVDPVGEIVEWHRRQKEWAEIQAAGGLEAYKKALLESQSAQTTQQQSPAQTQQVAQQTQAMPTDMATARSAAPRDGGFSPANLDDMLKG